MLIPGHSKIFYLNSKNRLGGTHENMSYKLDFRDLEPDHVMVLSANIPKSFYMIQDGYNTLTLSENGSEATITMPIGNYSRKSFKNVMQSHLNSESPNNWTYSILIPESTAPDDGKYTINVSGNGGVQPILIFTDNNIPELFGFESNSSNQFINNSLKSTNVIKMQREDTIQIQSDIVSEHSIGVLQEINCTNSVDFDNITFQNSGSVFYAKRLNNRNSNVFNFRITNENGQLLSLNGNNWTCTILLFKADDSNQTTKQFLRYNLLKN